ncbi:hypothetical protein P691DRAFT_787298 [Macrolepiota fuliginosa MF-IS2]|uniref:Uncharacterized protein n=1 Tax=Macrolepiota fuliginosa MF-IS2 TaxID=1400762 RepID=A0A9P5X5Y5_9AGAR|nr:hypothetical protein P691DRAFT_787298 [Macrolepiota fuliginosa MF-IS2]
MEMQATRSSPHRDIPDGIISPPSYIDNPGTPDSFYDDPVMDSIIATLPDTFELPPASSVIGGDHSLVAMQVEEPSNNSPSGLEDGSRDPVAFANAGALDDRSRKELGIALPDDVLNLHGTVQRPAPRNWYFVARGHCPGIYQDVLTAGRYASVQKATILEFGSQADADRCFVDHFMRGNIVRLSEWSEPIPLGVLISRNRPAAPPEEPDDEISWWVVPVARWPGCTKGRTTAERIAGTAKSFIEKANNEADAYRAFVSKYMSGAVHDFFSAGPVLYFIGHQGLGGLAVSNKSGERGTSYERKNGLTIISSTVPGSQSGSMKPRKDKNK